MKRIAVFAHYDFNNKIDNYVIFYLKALKKLCETIVFVSCCDIPQEETEKLNNIADYCIAKAHNEYDFGSYKRGFFLLKDKGLIQEADSLIFANDSCYGPIHSLENVFSHMDNSKCDFWGITKNKFGLVKKKEQFKVCIRPHLQSYFLVFNSQVFKNTDFENLMASIHTQPLKNDVVIEYEIGLYEKLINLGYKDGVYIKDYYNISNSTILKWRQLLPKSPFIKCNLLRQVYNSITVVDDWQEQLAKYSNYPQNLITENLIATMKVKTRKTNLPLWVKRLIFDIMAYMPASLRRLCSIIIGRILKGRKV